MALSLLLLASFALWVGNSSWLVRPGTDSTPRLIAHRGVHQVYAGNQRSDDTCRAAEVFPITHSYIENTLPSMRAAFDAGAAVVELDVQLTTDGAFAVFHDWTLDCQTDGSGETHKHTLSALKALDLGHGFSSDGTTFPLRGQSQGLLPSLREVLAAELPGPVLINFKSRRREEGEALARLLSQGQDLDRVFGVYGGGPPTQAALANLPGLRGYDRASIKSCLILYLLLGWSGHVPKPCQETLVAVPENYAALLWGWPHRFTKRLEKTGSEVILTGPLDQSGYTTAFNDAEALERVPEGFSGYVWTDRIEITGRLLETE